MRDSVVEDQQIKKEKCIVCNIIPEEATDGIHLNSALHRYNWVLYLWKKNHSRFMNDRHGIEITVSLTAVNGLTKNFKSIGDGEYMLKISPEELYSLCKTQGNILEFTCAVKNKRKNAVYITSTGILYDYELYNMKVPQNQSTAIYHLEPGCVFQPVVQYRIDIHSVSNYKIPVYFSVQTADGRHSSTYFKNIIVSVENDIFEKLVQDDKSPFTGVEWERNVKLMDPIGVKRKQEEFYAIPKRYEQCLKSGMKEYERYADVLKEIKQKLEPEHITVENYKDFFHILLWLEEIKLVFMLGHYNMEKVTLIQNGNMFNLTVPGLSEKRPSVIPGDYIDLKVSESLAYRGVVENVNDETIDIKNLDERFSRFLRKNPGAEIDVRFVLGRIHLERMHQGVDQVVKNKLVHYLFPDEKLGQKKVAETIQLVDDDFFNKTIARNMEQRTAVLKILNRTSGNVPYIVYGPPGTGKTVTIVEAIRQLKVKTNKTILVCAPANAACNMLTEKLRSFCDEEELIRIMSDTADMDQVHEDIKKYVHTNVSPDKLPKHRIVVTTLILSGKYTDRFAPDVVFIDEAAQPTEPEACCAIGLLKRETQIILAGDPNQLGPNVRSAVAEKYGLQTSLLERLVNSDLYKTEDPNFITMLKENYRSHEMILRLPNKLFYSDKLKAVSISAKNDPISRIFVYKNTLKLNKKLALPGKPLEFCAVLAKEQREGRSPSYFNTKEIEMVVRYVDALTSLPLEQKKVKHSEIGIVTPYIRQVYKIREKVHPEVEVGTTETFQGREKRVIIVTTVRAQEDLLLYDKMYDLGFIKHDKRFNVALTRAKSKLIVIGNPLVLQQDNKWKEYIDFCMEIKSYCGAPFTRRTEEFIAKMIHKVADIDKEDTQYEPSNKKNVSKKNKK